MRDQLEYFQTTTLYIQQLGLIAVFGLLWIEYVNLEYLDSIEKNLTHTA